SGACAGFACAVAAAAGTAGSPLAPPGSGMLPEGSGVPVGTACSRMVGSLSLTDVAPRSPMAPDPGRGRGGPTVTRCLTTRPRHAGGPPGGRARTRARHHPRAAVIGAGCVVTTMTPAEPAQFYRTRAP